jgi:hypothetical protein
LITLPDGRDVIYGRKIDANLERRYEKDSLHVVLLQPPVDALQLVKVGSEEILDVPVLGLVPRVGLPINITNILLGDPELGIDALRGILEDTTAFFSSFLAITLGNYHAVLSGDDLEWDVSHSTEEIGI